MCFLAEDLQLTDVIARGKFVMQDGTIVKKEGTNYEEADYILYWIPLYLFICNSETDFGKAKR